MGAFIRPDEPQLEWDLSGAMSPRSEFYSEQYGTLMPDWPETGAIAVAKTGTGSALRSHSPTSTASFHSQLTPPVYSTLHPGGSSVSLMSTRSAPLRSTSLYVAFDQPPERVVHINASHKNTKSKSSISIISTLSSSDSRLSAESTRDDVGSTTRERKPRQNQSIKQIQAPFTSMRSLVTERIGRRNSLRRASSQKSTPSPSQASFPSSAAPISYRGQAQLSPHSSVPRRQNTIENPRTVPEVEIRLRQLSKVSRMLGEQVPAELVLGAASEYYLLDSSSKPPLPPPKAEIEKSGSLRAPARMARRASLSLLNFAGFNPQANGVDDSEQQREQEGERLRDRGPPREPRARPRNLDIQATKPYRPRPESELVVSPIAFAPPQLQLPPNAGYAQSFSIIALADRENEMTFEMEADDNEAAYAVNDVDLPQIQLAEPSPMPAPSRSRSPEYDPPAAPRPSFDDSLAADRTEFLSVPRAETPFADYTTTEKIPNSDGLMLDRKTRKSAVMRKERRQGWSGEWNQDNMQDVISKLRNLK